MVGPCIFTAWRERLPVGHLLGLWVGWLVAQCGGLPGLGRTLDCLHPCSMEGNAANDDGQSENVALRMMLRRHEDLNYMHLYR
jgi:hypothetical protein